MKIAKIADIVKAFEALRENGLSAEKAKAALVKSYEKKGFEGDCVLQDDGDLCAFEDIEFKEVGETKTKEVADNGDNAENIKAMTESVIKAFGEATKQFVPATPIDREEEAKFGFKHCADYMRSLKSLAVSGKQDSRIDALREKSAPTTALGESTGEAGGVFVPPAFLDQIYQYQNLAGVNLQSQISNIPVSGNSIDIPSNEETPWGGGVQATWQSELDVIGQTRPSFKNLGLKLNDLTILCPIGNNLLEDSSAASAVLQMKIAEALNWKMNEAIINGGGVGMPLGILNAGNLVSVARTTANSITFADIVKMDSRLLSDANGVWFVTPQGKEQLMNMVMPGGLIPASFPIQTGFSPKPLPSIFGRPVVVLENCSKLGQAGDIILADMRGYTSITKQVKMATSLHMFFDTNATAFRAVARMDGKPWATKPVVSAHDPLFKRSHFVTLAAK